MKSRKSKSTSGSDTLWMPSSEEGVSYRVIRYPYLDTLAVCVSEALSMGQIATYSRNQKPLSASRAKGVVVCKITHDSQGVFNPPVYGFSFCSPTDRFNESFGKGVALVRAKTEASIRRRAMETKKSAGKPSRTYRLWKVLRNALHRLSLSTKPE